MPATIGDVYRQFNPLKPPEANHPCYGGDCRQERGPPAPSSSCGCSVRWTRPSVPLQPVIREYGKTNSPQAIAGAISLTHDERDIVAFGEADERLDLSDVEYDDVLLALLAVVDQTLRERSGADMEAHPFQRVWEDHAALRIGQCKELTKMEVPLGWSGN